MEFTDILNDLGIPYYTEGKLSRPGWLQLDCPWCGSPGKPGLGYNIRGRYLNCYKCGSHSAASVLHEVTKRPYDELRKLLGKTDGLDLGPAHVHTGTLQLPKGLCPLKKVHARYLEGRGFDPAELVATWGIQGLDGFAHIKTPEKTINLAWRIYIPIIWRGVQVSWTSRSISATAEKRYISAPSSCEKIPAKQVLYGADYCTHAACAIEGPIDVWKFGKGGVGLCGVGFTRAQVRHLADFHMRGICMDNEEGAQMRARELCDLLMPFGGETMNFVLDSKDPGEASLKEINTMRGALGLPLQN